MISSQATRDLLSAHGQLRSQPARDWIGTIELPSAISTFYSEVGPVNIEIESFGNPFLLPSLADLWHFQEGYRWNLAGEAIPDWPTDWIVVAGESGGAFIFSKAKNSVFFALHGPGEWDTPPLFPDLNAMAASLATLGILVRQAGRTFTDRDSNIMPEHLAEAAARLNAILGSHTAAESVLTVVGWQ